MVMESQIVKIDATDWANVQGRDEWTAAVEAGKVLYFPQLTFQLSEQEKTLLRPDVRDPKTRNISLNVDGSIKGVAGDQATQQQVAPGHGADCGPVSCLYACGAHGAH